MIHMRWKKRIFSIHVLNVQFKEFIKCLVSSRHSDHNACTVFEHKYKGKFKLTFNKKKGKRAYLWRASTIKPPTTNPGLCARRGGGAGQADWLEMFIVYFESISFIYCLVFLWGGGGKSLTSWLAWNVCFMFVDRICCSENIKRFLLKSIHLYFLADMNRSGELEESDVVC